MPDLHIPPICDLRGLNQLPTESLNPLSSQSSVIVWNPQGSAMQVQGVSVRVEVSSIPGIHREEVLAQLNRVLLGVDEKIIRGISQHRPLTIKVGPRAIFEQEHPNHAGEAKSTGGVYYSSSNKILIFSDRILKASALGKADQSKWFHTIFRHALFHEIGHAVYFQMLRGAHELFEGLFKQFPQRPLFHIKEGNVTIAVMPDKRGAPDASDLFAEGFREIFSRRFSNQIINYEKALQRGVGDRCMVAAIQSLRTIEQKIQSRPMLLSYQK